MTVKQQPLENLMKEYLAGKEKVCSFTFKLNALKLMIGLLVFKLNYYLNTTIFSKSFHN